MLEEAEAGSRMRPASAAGARPISRATARVSGFRVVFRIRLLGSGDRDCAGCAGARRRRQAYSRPMTTASAAGMTEVGSGTIAISTLPSPLSGAGDGGGVGEHRIEVRAAPAAALGAAAPTAGVAATTAGAEEGAAAAAAVAAVSAEATPAKQDAKGAQTAGERWRPRASLAGVGVALYPGAKPAGAAAAVQRGIVAPDEAPAAAPLAV